MAISLSMLLCVCGLSVVCGFNKVSGVVRESVHQVIGHAGSSGYLPESTKEGYDLAGYMLADYSEPDLVLTGDGHFIAMHDLTLEGTTNVESFPEYKNRISTFVIEGEPITGYYAINFTLSEVKGLRVRQRHDSRSNLYNWLFQIPTLADIISWQLDHYSTTGRLVGLYPELKHPDWYNLMGFPMEDMLLRNLEDAGYHINDPNTPSNLTNVVPVAIQCFKNTSLRYLAERTKIPLVQLMGISNEQPDPAKVYTQEVLDEIATYAQAVAPDKKLFTEDWGVVPQQAVKMRQWATERNLLFVPWSFQVEDMYIPSQFAGDHEMELKFFYGCLQSSGLFHEFPDHARQVAEMCRAHDGPKGNCLELCPYKSLLKL
mmetsp:Transcript_14385/g.21561  ORF Transcript_14385/g.21561 Transcript_14385/m.21561 type:complete len:373 (+) Transcript_14385:30-1148(+)